MGPIHVGIYADKFFVRYYNGGILQHEEDVEWRFNKKGQFSQNHDVLLVGYSEDYWLIENNWGATWGINGYGKIKMGDYHNICHLASGIKSQ